MFCDNIFLDKVSVILNLILLLIILWLILKKTNLLSRVLGRKLFNKPVHFHQASYYQSRLNNFDAIPTSSRDIMLLGDSLTDDGLWSELLRHPHVINRGISGDTTEGLLFRLDRVINCQPQKIFLMIGINDLWQKRLSLEAIINNYTLILKSVKEKNLLTKVYVQSILYVNNKMYSINIDNASIEYVNKNLAEIACKFGYTYIDIASIMGDENKQLSPQYTYDGVHLNGNGYIIWSNVIKPLIDE